MNKERRKRIEKLFGQIDEIVSLIESIRDDEQDAFDNLPESFQESEKGEKMTTAIDCLEDALTDLENTKDNLQLIIDEA